MSYGLILYPKATQQAQDAYEYYEKEQIGLGERFLDVLKSEIDYIQKYPRHFKKIKNEIREALLHRFPYLIIYELVGKDVAIYAIFHTSQNPDGKLTS